MLMILVWTGIYDDACVNLTIIYGVTCVMVNSTVIYSVTCVMNGDTYVDENVDTCV